MMKLNTETKVVLGGVGVLVAVIVIAAAFSNAKLRSLEREADAAKHRAKSLEETARDAETRAAEYRQKTEYLESEIAGIGRIARKQDEELKKIDGDVRDARGDIERARRVRTVNATADQLCGKLAELGHPCDRRVQFGGR